MLKKQEIRIPRPPHAVIIDGKAYQRDLVKYTAADDRKRQFDSIGAVTQYVIVSYESVLDDSRMIRRLHPGLVILDECTQIKSFRAQRAKRIKKMLSTEFRLGLTGTPIENGNPAELFSIMQWIDEDVLGRWDLFDKSYIERSDSGMPEGYKNIGVLRERLAPAMARLSRHDPGVREYLPEETMDTWDVQLPADGPMREAYMVMGRRLHELLKRNTFGGRGLDVSGLYGGQADESTRVGKIMAVHTAMEQLLDHPDLVVESGMHYEAGKLTHSPVFGGSKYAYEVWQDGLLDDVWTSPKLEEFTARLERLLAFGGKVLVFSKYASMLPLLADVLGVPSVCYYGGMSAHDKASAVALFGDPVGPPVFLSSHAGAYGVDMFMADHLVNFDNAWSPGRADQVNSRHVRASSEFERVFIHSMITAGTIEERIMDVQAAKRKVSSAIADGHGAPRGRVSNDAQTLTSFLEKTIDGLV